MRIQRIGMLAAVASWPVNAAHAQAYWGYGAGNRVRGYTEAGQGWQGNGYGYVKECEKSCDVCSGA